MQTKKSAEELVSSFDRYQDAKRAHEDAESRLDACWALDSSEKMLDRVNRAAKEHEAAFQAFVERMTDFTGGKVGRFSCSNMSREQLETVIATY